MMKHSEEFKQEAVRIALTIGLTRERVAKDLGIGKSKGLESHLLEREIADQYDEIELGEARSVLSLIGWVMAAGDGELVLNIPAWPFRQFNPSRENAFYEH